MRSGLPDLGVLFDRECLLLLAGNFPFLCLGLAFLGGRELPRVTGPEALRHFPRIIPCPMYYTME